MARVIRIQEYGALLAVLYDDGTRQLAKKTNTGLWIVGGEGFNPDPGGDPGGDKFFMWPFPLETVTSEFKPADRPNHEGMDFGIGGGTPIPSAGAGVVVVSNNTEDYGGYGNAVIVDHGDVGGENYFTLYGHMQYPGPNVSVGQTVTKGQTLGPVGNTGNSFGNHLHFEVSINGRSSANKVNPRSVIGVI